MTEVERLADRVILLHAGRIIEDETPRALIATYGRETLEDVFLDVVRGRTGSAGSDRAATEGVVSTPPNSRAARRACSSRRPQGMRASLRRIGALVRRYVYLLRSSGVRLVELIYWPFLQMLTWGFLQKYLAEHEQPVCARRRRPDRRGAAVGHFVSLQIGFSTTFIEEMWSRNLGNLLISPLRPYELVVAL